MNRAVQFGGIRTLFISVLMLMPVHAGVVNIFIGTDFGTGPGGSYPNSDAAANSFRAAVGLPLLGLINFENMSVGTGVPLSFGGGTLTASNASNPPFLASVQSFGTAAMGFNTTPGGSNYFRVDEQNGTAPTVVTFDFIHSTYAFGAYISGLGTAAGSAHLLFNDGAPEDFAIVGNANGGVLFFGFVSDSRTSSVTLQLDPVGGFVNDGIGIDDVMFTTNPEPGTVSLLGIGAVAFGLWRRKRS